MPAPYARDSSGAGVGCLVSGSGDSEDTPCANEQGRGAPRGSSSRRTGAGKGRPNPATAGAQTRHATPPIQAHPTSDKGAGAIPAPRARMGECVDVEPGHDGDSPLYVWSVREYVILVVRAHCQRDIAFTRAGTKKSAEGAGSKQTEAIAQRLLAQFKCNNFAVTDELLVPLGAGVFPAAALLNHSCAPNCALGYHLRQRTIATMSLHQLETTAMSHIYYMFAIYFRTRLPYLLTGAGTRCVPGCGRC